MIQTREIQFLLWLYLYAAYADEKFVPEEYQWIKQKLDTMMGGPEDDGIVEDLIEAADEAVQMLNADQMTFRIGSLAQEFVHSEDDLEILLYELRELFESDHYFSPSERARYEELKLLLARAQAA
jgi:hypothetical protein